MKDRYIFGGSNINGWDEYYGTFVSMEELDTWLKRYPNVERFYSHSYKTSVVFKPEKFIKNFKVKACGRLEFVVIQKYGTLTIPYGPFYNTMESERFIRTFAKQENLNSANFDYRTVAKP